MRILTSLIIGILFLSCENDKIKLIKTKLQKCYTEIILPQNFSKNEFYDYTEGHSHTFYYSDKSILNVICGELMDFEIPKNKKGKFWKSRRMNGKKITYGNANTKKKKLFEKAFNEMNKN